MTFRALILAVIAGGMISSGASASTLLITSDLGELGVIGEPIEKVHQSDPTWTDVAVDSKGRVFATDGGALYRIRNGRAQFLGEHAFMNGLAFDSRGRLFGTGDGKLYRLNRKSGRHRAVGNVGRGFLSSGDIAFDDNDRLWGVSAGGCSGRSDCLFKINADTGRGRLIGDIGARFVYGLAVDDGRLVGLTDDARLLRINKRTGAGRMYGSVSLEGFATGLASFTRPVPPPPEVIPLPASGWMLMAALALFGARRLRRSDAPG